MPTTHTSTPTPPASPAPPPPAPHSAPEPADTKPVREWSGGESAARYGGALLAWIGGTLAVLVAASVPWGWIIGLEAGFLVLITIAIATSKDLELGRKIVAWGSLAGVILLVLAMGWKAYESSHEAQVQAIIEKDGQLNGLHAQQVKEKNQQTVLGADNNALMVEEAMRVAKTAEAQQLVADIQAGNGTDVQEWKQEQRVKMLSERNLNPIDAAKAFVEEKIWNLPDSVQCLSDRGGFFQIVFALFATVAPIYAFFVMFRPLVVVPAMIIFRGVDDKGVVYTPLGRLWAPLAKGGMGAIIFGLFALLFIYILPSQEMCVARTVTGSSTTFTETIAPPVNDAPIVHETSKKSSGGKKNLHDLKCSLPGAAEQYASCR